MNASAPLSPKGADFQALDDCHRQVMEHLGRLSAFIEHLDRLGVDPQAQAEAQAIEVFFSGTSRQHHLDEERQVFPDLLASGDVELAEAVKLLQQDHGWIEEDWIALAPQLRAVATGQSWYDIDELRHAVQVFVDLCKEHIELEESLIYPQAKARAARLTRLRADKTVRAGG